ncbi:MAG TPA: hypothetical protein VKA09_11450 [Nitrososphaeraceae archaeon]|nr:hypothetical protein [Nitrososphaeraceae archaeon]
MLVLVFGSFFSSSSFTLPNNAFADDMMGGSMGGGDDGGEGGDYDQGSESGDGGDNNNDDDPNDMPKDAPLTTDSLTAGGGSDNNDDDGNDNNDDDETTPKDAPATANALTAQKIECPPGQEVTLFSTTCTAAGPDSTQGTTSAATVCPTSPTPTSYGSPLSVTRTVWEFSEAGQQQDIRKSLLHRVQDLSCPVTYEPSPDVLPYKGNEAELVRYYEYEYIHAKVTSLQGTHLGFFTLRDGTIMQVTIESDSNNYSELTRHAQITPGSNTPLDRKVSEVFCIF